MARHQILYVEDDDDIRDTMTMLLEHEGYQVTGVGDAEAALAELARSRYDLLLTDYQLPRENAAWLIRSARSRGALGTTPVIVLSGANDPQGIDGYRFLRKPVSQEVLLAAFQAMIPEPQEPSATPRGDAELRLRLYVSGESHASRKALRNLRIALDGIDERRVALEVHDIDGADRSWEVSAEEDRVVVIPTLIRCAPLPRVWIAGDLSDVEVVRDAIVPVAMQTSRSPVA